MIGKIVWIVVNSLFLMVFSIGLVANLQEKKIAWVVIDIIMILAIILETVAKLAGVI
jgi:hypothetical protein